MSRLRTLGVLTVLVGGGVILAAALLSNLEVRRWLHVSPDVPLPLHALTAHATPGPVIIPLDQMAGQQGPNPFQRPSWENIEQRPRPKDPRTDPLRGTTQTMYLHTRMETLLSSLLRAARLPCKVLRVGVWSPGGGRGPRRDAICFIELYSGVPPCRDDIEESADRAIQMAFEALPGLREVDVVAVPWRTVQGMKPPVRFSATATRSAWFGVAGARTHAQNLRTCGAVWVDPHVMWDCEEPLGPQSAPRAVAGKEKPPGAANTSAEQVRNISRPTPRGASASATPTIPPPTDRR